MNKLKMLSISLVMGRADEYIGERLTPRTQRELALTNEQKRTECSAVG